MITEAEALALSLSRLAEREAREQRHLARLLKKMQAEEGKLVRAREEEETIEEIMQGTQNRPLHSYFDRFLPAAPATDPTLTRRPYLPSASVSAAKRKTRKRKKHYKLRGA